MTGDTVRILEQLNMDGIAVLPGFVQGETLSAMQRSFEARLRRLKWNDFDGYERTERFRLMVQDVLTLDRGFVTTALDPVVKQVLRDYLGDRYRLVEAKGWRSLPTRRPFHGWHGDAWYDKSKVSGIPREIKLGLYLTDVATGNFRYLRGSHRQYEPREWRHHEIAAVPSFGMAEVIGDAGTAFLFDTSGIHGQAWPILKPRHAVFYNYHDPGVPLQPEDLDYYRYHPLLLNAALLGNLTAEDQSILGFGDMTNYVPAFERNARHEGFQIANNRLFATMLVVEEFTSRVATRLRRMMRGKR